MLKEIVSKELVDMLGRSVQRGYILANTVTQATDFLNSPVGRETMPYFRRAAIEFLVDKDSRTVADLKSVYKSNRTRNSHHVELTYDDRLVITVNHLASINGVKQEIPRHAKFRKELAKKNPQQILLFPHFQEKYFGDDKIHTALVHEGRSFPERVALIVLDSKCKKIVDLLPVKVSKNINSDVNLIEGLSPEFLEFVKKVSADTK